MVCFCCHLLAKAIVKSMRLRLSLQESICRPLLQKECQYLWMSQAVSQEVAPQVQNWLIRYLPPSQRIFAKGPCPCKAMLQKCTHQQASLRGLLIKCQLVLTGGVLSPLQCFTNPDTDLEPSNPLLKRSPRFRGNWQLLSLCNCVPPAIANF